ncbi:hypothetical protein EHP00_1076 [Ecytonucleospora hepatopenaei]|uniref:Uncharacterized protein n=1 Tax=Ecytonucleospora hepatopenaei TaxID=646526 RepID=A0A1W0E569_9MICR|nr:hypothetical protein EHP00_1076 [Ecytonucleospora hepatopenaei]
MLIFFYFYNFLVNSASISTPKTSANENSPCSSAENVQEFLSFLDEDVLTNNRGNSKKICETHNISMDKQTLKRDGVVLTFSIFDTDKMQMSALADFVKKYFTAEHADLLDNTRNMLDLVDEMLKIFGNGEIPQNLEEGRQEYNSWLGKNDLALLKVKEKTFQHLFHVRYDPKWYKGPDNLFWQFLGKKQNLLNSILKYNNLELSLKVLRSLKGLKQKFGYFYGCFVILKKYLKSKMEPCENSVDFNDFEGKITKCNCISCSEYKPLIAYLLHLQGIFDTVITLHPLEQTYSNIKYYYENQDIFKKDVEKSIENLKDFKKLISD